MIDKWFKQDLQDICEKSNVVVFVDESGDAEFLLSNLGAEYAIQQVNTELEELHVKYLVEKAQPSHERFLIYTRSKKDELKYIREYCETCGCLEIRYLQNYIKDKVHQTLNLNINLPKEELIAAAKVSVGKDRTYWMDLSHKGATEIFDLKKELLPFVHDPEGYSNNKYDAQLRETFYRKVNQLLGQEYLSKPPRTLANEVVGVMFDGLSHGKCDETLKSVYQDWLDSVSFRSSFDGYLLEYKLPSAIEIWEIDPNHPFREVDERWLAEIGLKIGTDITTNVLAKLRQRNQSKQANGLGITFWSNIIILLEFDSKDIDYLSSLDECVEFYKKHFAKLDTAIRNLYTEFLNKKELLEPFQELYKEHVSVFLDKWFRHWDSYKENQTGTLQRIIDGIGDAKVAVIVGDGVAFEIAELVADRVKSVAKLKKDSILADTPSVTENNMSRIYMDSGTTETVQANRESYLSKQNPDLKMDFVRLDEVNEDVYAGQVLICTYKDIDDMGEKLQQKALKYFNETIDFFADKISQLLANGYTKVYLVSDHGFVLTGILTEADKISVVLNGETEKAERYIRSEVAQQDLTSQLVEIEKSYKQFNYLYFSKTINPFKTPGLYGFSHGGLSPQELITPYFCWEQSSGASTSLPVSIVNKKELKDVTGELFTVCIQGDEGDGGLFSLERKVYMVFFADKTQLNKSDVFTIMRSERITKEYTFDGHSEIEVQLLDASSKQQLDRTVVKQNNDRDLGGLL